MRRPRRTRGLLYRNPSPLCIIPPDLQIIHRGRPQPKIIRFPQTPRFGGRVTTHPSRFCQFRNIPGNQLRNPAKSHQYDPELEETASQPSTGPVGSISGYFRHEFAKGEVTWRTSSTYLVDHPSGSSAGLLKSNVEGASVGLRFESVQRGAQGVEVWMFERRKEFRNGGPGDNKCCPTE